MSEWAAKRFWSDVTVSEVDGGFAVSLDGRPIKTPAKQGLVVPTRPIAEAIALEWDAVVDKIQPDVMPYTRSANAAIDKVQHQFTEVADMLAAYAESDLLCHRADAPAELVERQSEAWDPLLTWAHETLGGLLIPTQGIMPVEQAPDAVRAIAAPLYEATPFELTALHDLVSLSGSLVIALSVTKGHLDAGTAWSVSRIDEDWQADQWGHDEDAVAAAEIKRLAYLHAADFYEKLQN